MEKLRSVAILVLGLACLVLIACQTPGTPRQAGSTPGKSGTAAGPQELPPAGSVSKNRTAGISGDAGKSVASAKLKKNPTRKAAAGKAVTSKVGNPANHLLKRLIGTLGRPISSLRALLYASLAVIFLVVIGAIAAERAGRRRRLAPLSLNARMTGAQSRPRDNALSKAG